MTLSLPQLLLGGTAIYCWLVAGVFLTFSDFVMKSLCAIPAPQGIAAMQSINVLVFRSIFMVGLFAISAVSLFLIGYGLLASPPMKLLIISASALFLISVMGVTAAGNVPLNNALAAVEPSTIEAAAVWSDYLVTWTRWNHLRTLGSSTAAALFTYAAFQF